MGSRAMGAVLYVMVTEDAQIVLHRIRSDQMYHHYLGDPIEVLLLYPDGDSEVVTVGKELELGMRPQLLIPGGTFYISRLRTPSPPEQKLGYALLGTTEWPGVDLSDLELGIPEKLMEIYPHARHEIAEFTKHMARHERPDRSKAA